MQVAYHTEPTDLRAVIGPGISLDNFEVGDEVYEQFAKAGFPMDIIACRYEKWHIDLWRANAWQLQQAGIPEKAVHVCGLCTYTHYSRFFSARRLGINSCRIFTGIIKQTNHLMTSQP